MASNSTSSLEASAGKDENVERLFKIFTFKCLQVIVQSRIETQASRTSRDSSSADYFCITIPDNPTIEEQIRKALEGVKSFPVKDQSVCVEIPLVTNDGDHMFLETWDLALNLSSLDMSANKLQHIFTRMGVTLKSLLSATRAMPGYRLARNQGEKDGGYRLNYRFYVGKPQTHLLGDGFKTVHAGSVPSAYGLLSINVSFRTKLLLSPEMSAPTLAAIEVTDNYFVKEGRPSSAPLTLSDPRHCSGHHRSPVIRSDSQNCHSASPSSLKRKNIEKMVRPSSEGGALRQNSIFTMEELPEPVIGAFSAQKPRHKKIDLEVPFEGLMRRSIMARHEQITGVNQEQLTQTDHGQITIDSQGRHNIRIEEGDLRGASNVIMKEVFPHVIEDEKENDPSCELSFGEQRMSLEDDYVLVEKPPFAADDDPRDVKSFLRVMFRPANLYEMSDSRISVADYLNDIQAFVTKLEKDMPELDQFCESVTSAHSRDEEAYNQFS